MARDGGIGLLLAIVAGVGGATGWGLLAALIIQSYSNGWLVLVNFNVIGEGPLEIVLFPVFAVLSALGVYLHFIRNR